MESIILAVAITGSVAFAIGVLLGMSWQHKRSEAYIARLEARLGIGVPPKQGKPMITVDIDDYSDKDDWGEDTFDMDELQMRQAGSHQ